MLKGVAPLHFRLAAFRAERGGASAGSRDGRIVIQAPCLDTGLTPGLAMEVAQDKGVVVARCALLRTHLERLIDDLHNHADVSPNVHVLTEGAFRIVGAVNQIGNG